MYDFYNSMRNAEIITYAQGDANGDQKGMAIGAYWITKMYRFLVKKIKKAGKGNPVFSFVIKEDIHFFLFIERC